jgi:hypothetical protein
MLRMDFLIYYFYTRSSKELYYSKNILTNITYISRVGWNYVSNHALAVLGIAPPELYINPPVLHYFIYFRQLLIQSFSTLN